MESAVLRVGDIVALKHAKPNDGWLSAEGLISEELFLSKQIDDFSECLWEIHVQYQYSAIKEYETLITSGTLEVDLETENNNADGEEDVLQAIDLIDDQGSNSRALIKPRKTGEAKALEQLNNAHRAAINEQRLNEKIMALKVGKALAYGDLVQLKHVKSKKFLTVSQHTLARQEKENMRVMLQARGDNSSCLLFMPRFKSDREGQLITNNMEAFLRAHERPGEYIHAAKKNSYGSSDGRKEINCSLETSAWTIVCYQQAREMKAKTIMAGQLVTLQDPDNSTFLTLESLVPGVTQRSRVVMAPQFQLTSDSSDDNVGTNLLWLVEKDIVTVGGPIHVHMDRLTFRNLNTGLFMRYDPEDGIVAVKGRSNATVFEFTSQSAVSRGGLQEETAVQLLATNGGGWVSLQRDVAENSELDARRCELTHDKFSAIPFLVSASMLRTIGVDLYVAVQGAVSLREFEVLTRQMMTTNDPAISVSVGTLIKSIFTLLDVLNAFLSNDGTTAQEEIDLLLEKNSTETIARRQTMSREQGLIDVVLDIISLCELGVYDNVKAVARRDNSMMVKQQSSSVRGSFTATGSKQSQRHLDTNTSGSDPSQQQQARPARLSEVQRRLSVGSIGAGMLGGLGGGGANTRKSSRDLLTPSVSGAPAVSVHDAVRSTLKRLSSIDNGSGNRGSINGGGGNDGGQTVQNTLSQELAQCCLKLVLALVRGNHTSQMHIADRFPVILNQVRNQDFAVQCVKEMLRDNLLMLQTKVRKREIDIFVKLLVDFEMSVTFLKLLQSTCSCPMGVDNTQRMVTYALFGGKTISDNESTDSESREDEHDGSIRPVLIKLHANTIDSNLRESSRLDFTLEHSIYMPTDPRQYEEVYGRELLSNGLPSLFVSWHSDDHDSELSMLHLFDTNNMVPIDMFCHPIKLNHDRQHSNNNNNHFRGADGVDNYPGSHSPHNPHLLTSMSSVEEASVFSGGSGGSGGGGGGGHAHAHHATPRSTINLDSSVGSNAMLARNARRRQSQLARTTMVMKRQQRTAVHRQGAGSNYEAKMQVLNFFVAQLYLVADLCLDRNYVSIQTLEDLFPYDALLALLLTEGIPAKIKAPVCRMLRCMYVDREPQVAAIFPRLIRTSVTLKGGQENSFADHHMGSQYSFALLQQVISEYIRTSLTSSSKCDEFSAELMDLLQTLINFGFYSTPQQIRDILSPLVHGLDIHKQLKRHPHRQASMKPGHLNDSGGEENYRPQSTSFLGWILSPFTRWRGHKYRESQVLPGVDFDNIESDEPRFTNRYSVFKMIRQMQSAIRATFRIWTDNKQSSWQKRWYDITNTISYLVAVLVVVFISIAVLVLELVDGLNLGPAEIAILIFFGIELGLRIYCFYFIRRKITLFYRDPFNWLDTGLVLLDVVLLSTGITSGSAKAAQSVRAVRILRFLRLFRILRAARILRRLASKAGARQYRKIPSRYTNISEYEAKSVVSILKILTMIYDRIQDQNLGIFIKSFVTWFDNEMLLANSASAVGGGSSGHHAHGLSGRGRNGHAVHASSYTLSPIKGAGSAPPAITSTKSNVHSNDAKGNSGMPAILTKQSPLEVYLATIDTEEDVSTQIPASFDGVLIDMLMYADSDLVESALNLLMVHKSKNLLLFQAAEKTQIIYSTAVEAKYKIMAATLRDLKRLAEKFEIWGELQEPAHLQDANRVNDMLNQLTDMIKLPSEETSLNIHEEFVPDAEIQNLLLNLNGMPCFMTIQETLHDGGREEYKPLVSTIMRSCNELVYWFVKYNAVNQEVAFHHINWFFERMEEDVGSSKVIRGILQGNRALIKQCPKKFISDCAQKIIANGRKAMYLDMYLGMTELSQTHDCAVQSVESEISRHLTSREWAHKILLWCVPYTSTAYHDRRRDMEVLLHRGGNVMEEDMSPALRYHTSLITLLSTCNLGPKLQAIYPFEDVVHTIVDPTCVYPVKKALGQLLLEMMTCGIDGVEFSEELWKFFDNCCAELETIQNSIKTLLKEPAKNVLSRIRTSEWLQIVLRIIVVFFADSDFELSAFGDSNNPAFDNETNEGTFRATTRTQHAIESTIRRMFYAIRSIYQSYCSQVHPQLKETMKSACFALEKHAGNQVPFDPDHDDTARKPAGKPGRRSILAGFAQERVSGYADSGSGPGGPTPRTSYVKPSRFLGNIGHNNSTSSGGILSSWSAFGSATSSNKSANGFSVSNFFLDRRGRIEESDDTPLPPTTQIQYRLKYQEFTREVMAGFTDDQSTAVQLFESIPTEMDDVDSDVHLETLLRKLTSHIRSRFKRSVTHRKLDSSSTHTTGWLLKTFRLMLERTSHTIVVNHRLVEQSATVLQQSNSSSRSHEEQAANLREIFNENGVTYLCIDLLSVGIDIQVAVEAMQLLVMMLLVKGGNRPIQKTIYSYLKDTDSVLFFEAIKDIIDNLMVWCQKESELSSNAPGAAANSAAAAATATGTGGANAVGGAVTTSDGEAALSNADTTAQQQQQQQPQMLLSESTMKIPPELIVFRLLQLMCDGNYLPAKNLFRDQEGNSRAANIIDSLAAFIDKLSRMETHLSTRISIDVIKTMLKLMQGPCRGNQEHLIMHTELLVSLNRLMRTSRPTGANFTDAWAVDIETLRESIVDILLAAIEAQAESSVVFERVATTIELNVFHVILLPSIDSDVDSSLLVELIEEYQLTKLQAKYLVFLESLGDLRGILPTFAQEKIRNDIASVEIVHEDSVHRINFYKPDIVKDISKTSLASVTADIDCSAHERKLAEFLNNVSMLYREAKHQQYLRKFGMPDLWSWQNRLTWLMFSNAVIMNCLILGFYEVKHKSSSGGSNQHHNDDDEHTIVDDHYIVGGGDDHHVDDGDDHNTVSEGHRFLLNMIGMLDIHAHYETLRNAVVNTVYDSFVGNDPYSTTSRMLSGGGGEIDTSSRAFGTELHMSYNASQAVYLLTILQLLLAAAVVIIIIIVRVPVRYATHKEKHSHSSSSSSSAVTSSPTSNNTNNSNHNVSSSGSTNSSYNPLESVLYTILDPLPMWYCIYFLFTFLALFENRLFLSVLLLDFAVLDSTTRHLLDAVKNPARQLMATLVIIVIVLNVFAGIVFYFYRKEVEGFDIYSMWESFKLGLSYGIRGEYGVSHEMTNTLGVRMIVDLAFYFIVLAILRHIFFAIIVDTFGQLREDKFERDQHANNSCFICGVHRHDFDRISASSNTGGFAYHRAVTHNSLHYLYYIMSIWQSSEEDDNGIEMHVRQCLRTGEISWFPVGSSGHLHGGGKGGGGHNGNSAAIAHSGGTSGGGSSAIAPGGSSLNLLVANSGGGGGGAAHSPTTVNNNSSSSDGSSGSNHRRGSNAHGGGGGGGGGGHSSGSSLSRSGSNATNDQEMVSHILHIEQTLSRMMGGDSMKMTSSKGTDRPLGTISEREDDDDNTTTSTTAAGGAAISSRGRASSGEVTAFDSNSSAFAPIPSSSSKGPAVNAQIQQQLQQQMQQLQQQLNQQQEQHSNLMNTASTLNVSAQQQQSQALTQLGSKVQDVGTILRLVMNRLERLEGPSNNSKSSSSSKKASGYSSGGGAGAGGGGGSHSKQGRNKRTKHQPSSDYHSKGAAAADITTTSSSIAVEAGAMSDTERQPTRAVAGGGGGHRSGTTPRSKHHEDSMASMSESMDDTDNNEFVLRGPKLMFTQTSDRGSGRFGSAGASANAASASSSSAAAATATAAGATVGDSSVEYLGNSTSGDEHDKASPPGRVQTPGASVGVTRPRRRSLTQPTSQTQTPTLSPAPSFAFATDQLAHGALKKA